MRKKKILINIGTYLPGFRGGGPTKSIKNLVDGLREEFDIYILTNNHDLGQKEIYNSVKSDDWNEVKGINIFYTSEKNKNFNINKILKSSNFDVILLNSFFSTETIKILTLIKKMKITSKIYLMPRGELSDGALKIKKVKKMIYINFVIKTNLLKDITYLVTANDELEQVKKLLKTNKTFKVDNIPNTEKIKIIDTKEENTLKIVFLSRIVKKKNLDFALKTLEKCKGFIQFDIYGTIEDSGYWEYCKSIIVKLPKNIKVSYKHELLNKDVVKTLSNYDLFYFPTKSENYGHVISEALQASIPVLISDQTPWKDLNRQQFGWDIPLDKPNLFSEKINKYLDLSKEEFNLIKNNIFENYNVSENIGKSFEIYKKIFNS